jgi:dienelactone hydrolase
MTKKLFLLVFLATILCNTGCSRLINNLCVWRNDDYREAQPREPVTINLPGTFKTTGYIFKPFKTARQYPVVIVAHTLGGSKEDQCNLLARRIAKKGFLSLIFDLDGHGTNQYPFDTEKTIFNISKAIDYLYTRDDVDRQNIFVVGANLGAVLAIKAGVMDWRIKGVVAITPLYKVDINIFKFIAEANIFHLLVPTEVRFSNKKEFILKQLNRDLAQLKVREDIAKLAPHPLLLVHAEKDGIIGRDQVLELYNCAKDPKDLKIIPKAKYHTVVLSKKTTREVVSWLKQNST